MDHDLVHIVESFAGKRVLLLGDLILDRYVFGDADRLSPEAPVPVLHIRERVDRVGGAANAAACMRALGIEVHCCGVLGDDVAGEELIGLLKDMGIGADGVHRSADRPTTTKTRCVGLAQHRHRQQILRLDDECTHPLVESDAAALTKFARGIIADVDVVCIEDYDKGVVTPALAAAVIAEADRRGKPVLVDPARLPDYARYHGATYLTPNRSELSLAAGVSCDDVEACGTAAERVRQQVGAKAMIVTLDRDGALLVRSTTDKTHIPTRPRAIYDNTGAGDAVLAMLAAAVASDAPLEDAVALANIAGGLEVEKFGCVPITTDEVLAELRIELDRHAGKLRNVDDLLAELSLRRDRGETIVFTNGCFDILHAGHVDFLSRAARMGSVLVVGINADASVRALNKSPDRPVNNQRDRAAVLAGLESVGYVVFFDEPDPEALIRRVRPDVLVKGEDWADRGVVGRSFVESSGGRVELLPLIPGLSTTELVRRMRAGVGDAAAQK